MKKQGDLYRGNNGKLFTQSERKEGSKDSSISSKPKVEPGAGYIFDLEAIKPARKGKFPAAPHKSRAAAGITIKQILLKPQPLH